MKIFLSPLRAERAIDILREGEALIIDGQRVDFSEIAIGETRDSEVYDCPWILGDVSRDEKGVLHLMLALPHGGQADHDARFPQPLENPEDGLLVIPPYE